MNPRRRVVVTGTGAVSAFGLGVEALWAGLKAGQSAGAPIRRFDASVYRSDLAAEVPHDLLDQRDLIEAAGQPLESAAMLAVLAATEAWNDAGLGEVDKQDFGCVIGTLCSGARVFEDYCKRFMRAEQALQSYPDVDACAVYYQLEHLLRHFGLEGPSTLVSTACSSSTDAIGCATDFIRAGDADVMLAGGADILAEVVHAGFNAVFSITQDCPRPFDTRRSGFFIGEGAGMLVLEELEHARRRGAPVYAEVMGYGLSNAAHHLTGTSPSGAGESLAVSRCLQDAGVDSNAVDYVNAHGTATQQNDATEAHALRRVFASSMDRLLVTSIKANIGHCMGASGALEAVATLKCIEQGYIPPTVNSSGDLDPQVRVVAGEGVHHPIRHALSQSFGFGGACSAVLFGTQGAPGATTRGRTAW